MSERQRDKHKSSLTPTFTKPSITSPTADFPLHETTNQYFGDSQAIKSPAPPPAYGHDFARLSVLPPLQAKFAVSQPNDLSGQGAEVASDEETQQEAASLTTVQQNIGASQQATDTTTKEQDTTPLVQASIQSNSQPLDASTRAFMEPRFGHDFSKVRVHTDERAEDSAQALQALAYTTGHHIVFGTNQYAPGTPAGKHLLAHELTHVIQQRGAAPHTTASGHPPTDASVPLSPPLIQARLTVNTPSDSYEQEAEHTADHIMRMPAPVEASTNSTTQNHTSPTGYKQPLPNTITPGLMRQQTNSMSSPPLQSTLMPMNGGTLPTSIVQRKIVPENVSGEMKGRLFEVTTDLELGKNKKPLKAGVKVTIESWNNEADVVRVTAPGLGSFYIQKWFLKPTRTLVDGINPYSAGVSQQATQVAKGKQELDTDRNKHLPKDEIQRIEGLNKTRLERLNRKLIQETMFNRFDATIKREVDAANKAHGFTGANALDPNLFKAMVFEESQFGTSGEHLEDPPSHMVKTRFNIAQLVDSSALALLTLFEKEQPHIINRFALTNLRKDLENAKAELAKLQKKKSPSPADEVRLGELTGKSKQNWEVFIWGYPRFYSAVESFFASQEPQRNMDYDFWIHAAVFWLFEKHKPGMSWLDAIKAYNGTGPKAEHYRRSIKERSEGAAAAAKKGEAFAPNRI